MIAAEFFKLKSSFVGFKISGHAEYSDNGCDIVCAAVSSAVQLSANTLTDFLFVDANVKASDNTIYLMIKNSDYEFIGDAVIRSLMMHLQLISEQFVNTILITDTEVSSDD